jgi:subtilisin family serine protease
MRASRAVLALLITLILLAPTVASAPAMERIDAFRLSWVRGADPASPPTVQGAKDLNEAPWWERTRLDDDHDGMFDQLDALVDARSLEPVDVLVDLDHSPTEAEAAELAAAVGASGWGVFETLRIVGLAAVKPRLLPRLLELPGVVMLEPRMDPVPFQDVATPALKAQPSEKYSPYTAWELDIYGAGVNIAILDTGVDDAHSGLQGKFVAGVDFTKPHRPNLWPRDGTFNPDDTGGHGTTCAGIAMGTGAPGGDYIGAAPEAGLVDVRIGTTFGFSWGEGPNNFYDSALQAIDWTASHADTAWSGGSPGIHVLSLSWGVPFDGASDGTDAYSRGLDQCVASGVVSCVAAGNEGPDNLGITGMSASSRSIIVGALNDMNTISRDDDEVASYSSRGPRHDDHDGYDYDELKPDVTAPGTNINGIVYERTGDGSGSGYGGRGSGTSYATPYTAGVSALLLEANPQLTPEILREIMRATAERVGDPEFPGLDPFWNGEYGWGMVDAYNATLMALAIEDINKVDFELQAFVVNVTGGNSSVPELDVEGIAWARIGEVDHVEWRVNGGSWHTESLDPHGTGEWYAELDPADLGEGEHLLEAKAVSPEGMHSVWRPVTFNVTEEAVEASATTGGGAAGWIVVGILVLGVAGFWVWKRKPELVDKALRTAHIRK